MASAASIAVTITESLVRISVARGKVAYTIRPVSAPLKLLVISTPLLLLSLLYFAVRLIRISPPKLLAWLKMGCMVLLGTAVLFDAAGPGAHGGVVLANSLALVLAMLWIRRRYGLQDDGKPVALNLATPDESAHPR